VSFERGYVAVDATLGARTYRFVNTHLEIREPVPRQFQCAQAAELIATLEAATPPGVALIVVGDLNSSPEDEPVIGPLPLPPPCSPDAVLPPYMQLVDAGYNDVWRLRPGARRGFTCCQEPDLLNRRSLLDERIDFIFASKKPARVKQARVVGASIFDKTRPPGPRLWPSDHGGVVATLQFKRPRAGKLAVVSLGP
jgi:endonuclease/exonuclease/phosphatase family metal-dependent hydrolase